MAYVSIRSLLVIAYLQLCRSELVGSWYSANVINDGDFSPKPISEIFSTPPNFSPTNPIVVLSSSTTSPQSEDYSTFSTPLPPIPSSFSTSAVSDGTSGIYSIPTESVNGHGFPSFPVPSNEVFKFPDPSRNTQQGSPNYFLIYQQAPQTVQGISSPSGPGQIFSSPQTTVSTAAPETSSFGSSLSTYQPTVSTYQPTVSTYQPTVSTYQPTVSTYQPTVSTYQPTVSTFSPTLSTFQPSSSVSPSLTPSITLAPEISTLQSTLSTFASSTPRSTARSATTKIVRSSTAAPIKVVNCANNTNAQNPIAKIPSLRIRMLTPSGSITNIHINSPASSSTTTTKKPTTKRPKRATTTRKSRTTTKKPKRNMNTYETCVSKCDVARKFPICSIPLNLSSINPDKLKGFPSVCHMACHNSFRKDQYDMLINGRCGKLRTRIKTVDSDKLTKVELNKAQYTIEFNRRK